MYKDHDGSPMENSQTKRLPKDRPKDATYLARDPVRTHNGFSVDHELFEAIVTHALQMLERRAFLAFMTFSLISALPSSDEVVRLFEQ